MSLLSLIGRASVGLTALLASAMPGAFAGSSGEARDDANTDGAEKPAKSDSAGPPAAELKSAVDLIRTTARSIVAAFAAIAALVIGTAPLDKIGKLEPWSWQFFLAGGALLAVIAAIAFVISQAAGVSAPVGASPQELKIAEDPHQDKAVPPSLEDDHRGIEEAAQWIRDADLVDVRDVPPVDQELKKSLDTPHRPITFLADARDLARDQWLQGQLEVEAADEAKRVECEKANAGRKARLKRLDDELTYVINLANYRRLDRRFNKRKKRIVYGSVTAAVGIIVFKYAAYVNDETTPTPIKLDGITLARAIGVDLTGASLAGANLARADLRGANLSAADLTAANLTDADLRKTKLTRANLSAANLEGAHGLTPEDVKDAVWIGATCPDGTHVVDAAETCDSEQRLDGSG